MRMLLILFSFACFALAYDHNLYIENVKRVRNSLPTGTVLIWWTQADVPEDFIECDGRPVPEGTELRKLMSHTPNYVGKFLKGADETRGEKAGDEKGEKLIIPNIQNSISPKRPYRFERYHGVKDLFATRYFLPSDAPHTYKYAAKMPGFDLKQELIFATDINTEIFINDLPTDIDRQTYSQSKQIYKKRTDYQNGKYITQISVLHTKPFQPNVDIFDYVPTILHQFNLSKDINLQYDTSPTHFINGFVDGLNITIPNSINNFDKSKPVHVNTRYIIKL